MLAGSSTSASTLSTDTNPVSSTPSRTSRLRGLSYLRNYTHGHFHLSSSSPSSPQEDLSPRHQQSSAPIDSQPSGIAQSRQNHTHHDPHTTTVTASQPQRRSSDGWLPTVAGSSTTALPTTAVQSTAPTSTTSSRRTFTDPDLIVLGSNKTRTRTATGTMGSRTLTSNQAAAAAAAGLSTPLLRHIPVNPAGEDLLSEVPTRARATSNTYSGQLPSIQFIPCSEPHRGRPSLDFPRIARTLPNQSSIIKVGRYSERDSTAETAPSAPSDAPIGFKSKVVSRKHCEFSYSSNQWWVKDVKSSSGTFLNHIRLSQPGLESKPFPVKDGDVVQLGIDFKGGEENIFRCVKIRIETNRGWQRGLNKFK